MSKATAASPIAFVVLGLAIATVGLWALVIERVAFGVGMLVFAVGLVLTGLFRFRMRRRRG
ncbi:hypothetical protein Q7F20_00790 [Curtobacterium sp. A7_M15]|uniref:hypothetical protein n=1 Tax=Curtobacterium sp. A7_M15 TaxID=3065241 RepID=UPI002737ADAE|nr:hypothetical protein [Curtobacterium sp. A7_M15]MDP4331899.1 hypothetical protein [Curtobacterium sp. A7_M15]